MQNKVTILSFGLLILFTFYFFLPKLENPHFVKEKDSFSEAKTSLHKRGIKTKENDNHSSKSEKTLRKPTIHKVSPKTVFYQRILGKDYYNKKEAQSTFQAFLDKHPYSNHQFKSVEEWKSIPKKDRPDLAMEQEFLLTMDPATGAIPWAEKRNTYNQVQAMLRSKAAISGVTWDERGPNNVGGRTRAIMFDPNDATDKKVWAGAVSGGLWYNNDITDANSSWQHINHFWDNIAISAIAYDPSNTQTFYVGTGEGYNSADVSRGDGIWKSTDGGTTWTQLSSTNGNGNFRYVNDIKVTSTGIVIAGTSSGIFRSTNGGSSWVKEHSDNIMDLEKSKDGDLYAGDRSGQIYKSTDDGLTWSGDIAPSGGKRVEMTCAPSDNNIIYAVSGPSSVTWFKKSIDGGTTWTDVTIPKHNGSATEHFTRTQAWYDLILAVHPSNPDLVIAGGVDLHRTTDGGSTWAELTDWWRSTTHNYYAHADQHKILFRPNHPNEALFSNDGGLSYSTTVGDATATPQTSTLIFETRVKDYNVTQFYACDIKNEVDANYYLAGAQDNGSHKFESAGINATSEVLGGDGCYCFIDQDDATYQLASVQYNGWYRSTNGGSSFFSIVSAGGSGTSSFINPGAYDSEADILYTNRQSSTQIKRVSGISSTISNDDINLGITMSSSTVTHLKVSPYTNNRIFLGVSNGNIYKVDNAHATPTTVEVPTSSLPSSNVSCIEIGADDNHLLVTFSNYGVDSVWETLDGGSTWTSKEGNLPNMPVRWAIYNPRDRTQVLLATEFGVWSTDDLSAASVDWGISSTGLANTRCTMLKYREIDGQVVVASYGRGLFTTDVFKLTSTYFETTTLDVTEETDATNACRAYKDYTLNFNIVKEPAGGDAEITINQTAGTATQGVDYDIMTPMPLTFTSSSATSVPVTIRIYNDTEVESTESITLGYTLNAGTSNATTHTINQEFVMTITDDDISPGFYTSTLLDEDWATADFSTNNWTTTASNIGVSSSWARFFYNPTLTNYDEYLTSEVIDASDASNILLDYELDFDNFDNNNICGVKVEYKKNTEATWTVLEDFDNTVTELTGNVTHTYPRTGQVLAVDNSSFQIRFHFYGANSFSIDAIYVNPLSITGEIENTPSTGIISISEYLGPNQTTHFYNGTEIMASIENLSNHDYGCTTVEIDRTGTGATTFYNTSNSAKVSDKTFKVTPTNNNNSGNYRIQLYYTEAEIAGWESATGKNRSELTLLKSPDAITNGTTAGAVYGTSPSLVAFNGDHYVEAEFNTGFSGFGASISGSGGPLDTGGLPIELLDFEASRKNNRADVVLTWQTLSEINNKGFDIEMSSNGLDFEKTGFVEGLGNSLKIKNYEFSIHNIESAYYRLRQIDFDGSFSYSPIRFVAGLEEANIKIFPNPTRDKLSIQIPQKQEIITMEVFDITGKLRFSVEGKEETLNIVLAGKIPQLEKGAYIIRIKTNAKNYQEKFIKQ